MRRGMEQMQSELNGRGWCHNGRYSLADIALGCCLGWLAFRKPGGIDWHAEYPGLAQHYKKLMERQPFADTVPQLPK
jgi:glutathione S-transferase